MTIGDVAAEAGVSVATVSKVINDRWGVAEDTSARVRAVIEELGYQSSLVAQSLRSRRTNVIGILVVDIEPFSAELLKGVARAIHGTGYELVVFSGCGRGDDQVGWERRYLSRVSGTLCDGALLVTPSSVDVTFGAPVVAVDHNVGSSSLPERRLGQPQRRRRGDRVPARPRPPPDRLPRRPPRPRVGPAARARLPRRRSRRAGIAVDRTLDPRRRLPARHRRGGRAAAARAATTARPRSSPRTTSRRSRRWTVAALARARGAATICR